MNMNQKELALKANITESSLSRYENDTRKPKSQALLQIADALEVSTDYLLGITNEMSIKSNSLLYKSYENLEDIYESTKKRLLSGNIMLDGEIATDDAIDAMLKAIKMGMLLALEEQSKNRDK